MAVDVVVVSYHTNELLLDFRGSYMEHAFPGCALTVVDVQYGGEDASVFDEASQIHSIGTKDNIGYGAACNLGALGGENDVILLANADTLLTAGLLDCYQALMSHEDWAVLGPRQVDEFAHITAGGIFGTPSYPQQRAWQQLDVGQASDIRDDALSVSGSLYFIKRSVWNELTDCRIMQDYHPGVVGAFIETPHYFEEMTCSVHARGHGYKCVFYGPVCMVHLWHRASPHGGWADQLLDVSKQMHRDFCHMHGLECE